MKQIAIFASGSGTNAENIIRYFLNTSLARVKLVLSNKQSAKVLERASALDVKAITFNMDELISEEGVLKTLLDSDIDLIVLAGFLRKVPAAILKAFEGRMVNIHPALLPKYGGKGMYGRHVHEAVIANEESESGITIHYVNEDYDEGAIIFQASVELSPGETPESLANKVHELEYMHYPRVIERLLLKNDL